MGQYHGIYNKTKKEYYSLGGAKLWEKAYNASASMGLLVLLSNSNGRGGGDLNNPIHEDRVKFTKDKVVRRKKPLFKIWSNEKQKYIRKSKAEYDRIERALRAVSGRWAGDEIVVQGDYAQSGDSAFIPENELNGYKNITLLVIDAIEACLSLDKDDSDVATTLRGLQEEREWIARR